MSVKIFSHRYAVARQTYEDTLAKKSQLAIVSVFIFAHINVLHILRVAHHCVDQQSFSCTRKEFLKCCEQQRVIGPAVWPPPCSQNHFCSRDGVQASMKKQTISLYTAGRAPGTAQHPALCKCSFH